MQQVESTTELRACASRYSGKEQDAESELDYFGARYMSSTMGCFMSPDPGKRNVKHLLNPQKWNRYAYTLNNPLSKADPDGHCYDEDKGSTEDRVLTGLTGAANLYIGVDQGIETFGELAATPATFGAVRCSGCTKQHRRSPKREPG
jgi:RHS repeat-associated protein